jgi:CheY-like chemotaxis protein
MVALAHNGPDTLRMAAEFRPRVVLLDLGLPDMDGCEVARQLRQTPSGKAAVLIALTGSGEDNTRERAREAGFDRHLLKPVEPEALIRLLATIASGEAKAAPR